MKQPSLLRVVARRIADEWKLLLSAFSGVVVATTLVAGTPVYLESLEQLSFISSLDRLSTPVLDFDVSTSNVVLSERSLRKVEETLDAAINRHLSGILLDKQTYLRGATSLVGLPDQPLPKGGGRGVIASRGYLQALSRLEAHSRFVQGRMAGSDIALDEQGPIFEAVISTQTASEFDIRVGDVIILSPELGSAIEISVQIVGILEPDEPADQYWSAAAVVLDPPPLEADPPMLVQVDPEEPPVALFVTEQVMVDLLGEGEYSAVVGEDIYARSGVFLAGLPSQPLPTGGGSGVVTNVGYLMHLSNVGSYARFLHGRMAGSHVSTGPEGPVLEAVVARETSNIYRLDIGDEVTLSPALGSATVITAQIVGVIDPEDPQDTYWSSAAAFLNPFPLFGVAALEQDWDMAPAKEESLQRESEAAPLLVEAYQDAIPVFVTREAMLNAMEQAYPGSLVRPIWAIKVDTESLKGMSVSEARNRLKSFEDEVLRAMPGARVNTGVVRGLTEEGAQASFFSKVPLLLLLAVMVVTVLFFLSMVVSYLVQSREGDAALLRTRGVGTLQFLRLYALEGLVIAVVAVVLAPFLAMAAVAFAGVLPYFREMTGGSLLPVRLHATPFIASAGAGLLCLAIFIIPGVLGMRGGLLLQRLQWSRPPSVPFVHRYYLDFALMALGGLIFWELHQRGHFVSGGLFKDTEINEALLLAPVLFLVVVALLFMRLFPLIMRYISGESPGFVHLAVTVSVAWLVLGIVVRQVREGDGLQWLGAVALLLAIAGVYWATTHAGRYGVVWLAGLLVQAVLVVGFTMLEPPEPGQALFTPTVGLMAIVPVQLAFPLLRTLAGRAPAWLSLSLWHMARNPMQYAWLVLLLVLVTGLGILATTVGQTLERSRKDRIYYDNATDVMIRGFGRVSGGPQALKQSYLDIPGVDTAVLAVRTTGRIGPATAEVLALESNEFANISWYREDFSARSLDDIMGDLASDTSMEPLAIPEGDNIVGLWVKPLKFSSYMEMYIEIRDYAGNLYSDYLGDLSTPEWTLMQAEIPDRIKPPLYVASVQIFEAGAGTAGSILVDDIYSTAVPSYEIHILEDFEGPHRWAPIITSPLSEDRITTVPGDAFRGNGAGHFSFGKQGLQYLRGFYKGLPDNPAPVVVSSSLAAASGHSMGDRFVAGIGGLWVEVVIRDIIDYFPTLPPHGGGFMLVNLDNLLRRVNVLLDFYLLRPTDIFIGSAPGASQAVVAGVRELAPRNASVYDLGANLESVRLDPFVTAGWKPMVPLSLVVGGLAAAVGYVMYLLLFARRSWSDMASLKALGHSPAQFIALLGFQHFSMAAIGLGLGTFAGSQMSRLAVSPLAVTEIGEQVVPPFLLVTDWTLMLLTYTTLLAFFLAALFVLSRGIGRLELHTAARA